MQVSKPKKGYKFVDIGFGKVEEIPDNWKVKKLEEFTEFSNQGVNTAIDKVEYVENGISLVKSKDIQQKLILEKTDKISEESFSKIPFHHKPQKNDILFLFERISLTRLWSEFFTFSFSLYFISPFSINSQKK